MGALIPKSFEYTPQKMFQKGVERGFQKGKMEGKSETTKEFVINMLKVGMSIEQISEITELSIQQIKALQSGNYSVL